MTLTLITLALGVVFLVLLRRTVRPVTVAFRLGMEMGRQLQASEPGDAPASWSWRWLADVVFAWLLPWRSVAKVRSCREDNRVLVHTLAAELARQGCKHNPTGPQPQLTSF